MCRCFRLLLCLRDELFRCELFRCELFRELFLCRWRDDDELRCLRCLRRRLRSALLSLSLSLLLLLLSLLSSRRRFLLASAADDEDDDDEDDDVAAAAAGGASPGMIFVSLPP